MEEDLCLGALRLVVKPFDPIADDERSALNVQRTNQYPVHRDAHACGIEVFADLGESPALLISEPPQSVGEGIPTFHPTHQRGITQESATDVNVVNGLPSLDPVVPRACRARRLSGP